MSELEQEIADAMGDEEAAEPTEPTEPESEPEADDASEEEEEASEPGASEPRPTGATDREIDKAFKDVERSTNNSVKWVEALMEVTGLHLLACPLCPSQHKGYVDIDRAGMVPDEIRDSVLYYLGVAREQEYKEDGDVRTCPRCDGRGKTDTGSHVPKFKTRTCPTCQGYGFTPPPGELPVNGTAPTTFAFPAADDTPAMPHSPVDAWGEPEYLPDGRENPNFGKMPQFKIQVEPWGVTANLTAQDVAA